jgi:hypothetical protein
MAAREEDEAMAGLLRRSLTRGAGGRSGSGEDCPGPEILAAYFDRALDAQETARYDLHFSRCSVCREQLAAMARAAGVDVAEKKTVGAWDWLTGPRWLMPAAAMLLALLVFAGIARHMRKPVAPANQIAMSRTDAVPPPNSVPPANPVSRESSAPSPDVVRRTENAPALDVAPPATAENLMVRPIAPNQHEAPGAPVKPSESDKSRALSATSASPAMSRVSQSNTASRPDELSSAGAASAQPPVAQTPPPQPQTIARQKNPEMLRGGMRAGSASAPAGAPLTTTDETASVSAAAPALDATVASAAPPAKKLQADSMESDTSAAVRTDEAKEANALKTKLPVTAVPAQSVSAANLTASKAKESAAYANLQQAQISSNLMNLQIQTPDPKILWMVASPGLIEKSDDGGTTWKPEYVETRALILAGAAPTPKICWVVGVNGTILRTTNGTHWKTISPPAGMDFVRVEAADALTATVTATDGRRFSTSDGGKRWSIAK